MYTYANCPSKKIKIAKETRNRIFKFNEKNVIPHFFVTLKLPILLGKIFSSNLFRFENERNFAFYILQYKRHSIRLVIQKSNRLDLILSFTNDSRIIFTIIIIEQNDTNFSFESMEERFLFPPKILQPIGMDGDTNKRRSRL